MEKDTRNIEFNIMWCETNLKWLAGEPPSEERSRCHKKMIHEIERLKRERVMMIEK